MSFVEFSLAALTAFYAMVGGAILNAAITNPRNCRVLLNYIWNPAISLFWVSAILPGTVGMWFAADPERFDVITRPLFWFAAANLVALLILYIAQMIVRVLLGDG